MLKGNKIYLRLLDKKDIGILYKICSEDDVKRYNTIPSYNLNENKSSLRKALSIINEKNIVVGFITYRLVDHLNKTYFIGITIGSRYWGRKYGQDSIRTLLKYLFQELNAMRIELEVINSNLRAINCYKKCGFVEESIKRKNIYIDNEYVDTIIMGISRERAIGILEGW